MSQLATPARFVPTAQADWKAAGEVSLDGAIAGQDFSGSFAATLIVSADGKTLYALDQGNWRIVIIDAATMQRIASIATGNYPFGLALSPDGERLYVTNTGLFEYTTIPGANRKDPLGTGLHFPPFGYPSKAAREGAVVEGKKIAGLGNENSDRGSSLWTYDVRDSRAPVRHRKASPRRPDQRNRAARPSAARRPRVSLLTNDAVYVSLAHEDAVAKISADGTRLLAQTELSPFTEAAFQRRRRAAPCAA